jgi:hypothetical protein
MILTHYLLRVDGERDLLFTKRQQSCSDLASNGLYMG